MDASAFWLGEPLCSRPILTRMSCSARTATSEAPLETSRTGIQSPILRPSYSREISRSTKRLRSPRSILAIGAERRTKQHPSRTAGDAGAPVSGGQTRSDLDHGGPSLSGNCNGDNAPDYPAMLLLDRICGSTFASASTRTSASNRVSRTALVRRLTPSAVTVRGRNGRCFSCFAIGRRSARTCAISAWASSK